MRKRKLLFLILIVLSFILIIEENDSIKVNFDKIVNNSKTKLKDTDEKKSVVSNDLIDTSQSTEKIPYSVDIKKINNNSQEAISSKTDNTTFEEIDLSIEDDIREKNESGLKDIEIVPSNKKENNSDYYFYLVDKDGNIKSESQKGFKEKSYEDNIIKVKNKKIVAIDKGIVRTIGGYNHVSYMYSSLSDAERKENPTPISGGAYDATYLGTFEKGEELFVKLKIDGYEGFMNINDVSLIPENMIKSKSYYEVKNGEWVYNSAIDPLTSTEYEEIVLGTAPIDAQEGLKYYTDDDENFYVESNLSKKNITPSLRSNSYFQFLPFRSVSNYTASDFKSYLKKKGHSGSKYYNYTNAFVDAQNKEGINSLMLFSFANHEGAYGESYYSKTCNNFFGWGAYDSNPDNACKKYGWPTPYDGIMAESIGLNQGYFDVQDYRYNGTHVGNKSSGMNVKYASDPDWGKKISNLIYEADMGMGHKEENKYSIIKINGGHSIFNLTSSGYKKMKSTGDKGTLNYNIKGNQSSYVTAAAITDNGGTYKIYVPTPVQPEKGTCNNVNFSHGKYSRFNGNYDNINVAKGVANFRCQYGVFRNQAYYIDKGNTSILAGKQEVPKSNEIIEYYPDTLTPQYKYITKEGSSEIKYALGYDKNGNLIRSYEFFKNTKYDGNQMKHIQNKYYLQKDYTIDYSYRYDSKQKKLNKYEYHPKTKYLSNHKSKVKTRYDYNSDQTIHTSYDFDENQEVTVEKHYDHANENNLEKKKISEIKYNKSKTEEFIYKNGLLIQVNQYLKGTNYNNINNNRKSYEFYVDDKGNKIAYIKYAIQITNGKTSRYYEYYPETNYYDSVSKNTKDIYIVKPNNEILEHYHYLKGKIFDQYNKYKTGTQYKYGMNLDPYLLRKYNVKPDGKIIDKRYYSNGKLNKIVTYYNQYYNKEYDSKKQYIFYVDSNAIIKYALGFSNNKVIKAYEYNNGTIYDNGNLSANKKYIYNLKSNYLITDRLTYKNKKLIEVSYFDKQKYSYNNNVPNVIYKTDSNGYIKDKRTFVNGKLSKIETFYGNLKYGKEKKSVTHYRWLIKADGTIDFAYGFVNGYPIRIYEYLNGTTYDSGNLSKKYLTTYDVNSDKTIKYSKEYKNGIAIKKNIYRPGVKYGYQKPGDIIKTINL